MWIGVDDTDGPEGGCTTFVLTELLRLARDQRLDLLGYPRLVRLNPNVPWKTRGNGALAARLGHGLGRPSVVGEIGGRPFFAYARGRELRDAERRGFLNAAWPLVDRLASRAPRTDPVLVVADRPPAPALYRRSVADLVPLASARAALRAAGGTAFHRGSQRGLVGAAAAIAWPGRRRTFELLAYRRPSRIGRTRRIELGSLRSAVRRHPSLFLCEDPRTRRVLIAPHTDCPVLLGLRATDAAAPVAALRELRSEPVDRWMLFVTNQATGDHLVPRTAEGWPREAAGVLRARVVGSPSVGRGGHVRFRVRGASGALLECVAFEPTKTLPKVAASLRDGDRLDVAGGRGRDGTVRVERLVLRALVPRFGPARPPPCPACGVRSRSLGRLRGYRCPRCRRRFPPEAARAPRLAPAFPVGSYDPTASARRHLHPRVPEGVRRRPSPRGIP